eukprot:TRINITY_DN543_c1_g1_i2.p1 TRINITY_DN543_c1_g1~~TRINITY_DN543_c1_g1_i2.p1  ORF type:complete len:201 (+),score=61.24 TRINITY_DN543_c1_g1_i2:68-604(+)
MSAVSPFPENYGYVMLSAVGIGLQVLITGYRAGRYRIMNQEWVEKNLKQENEVFKKKYGYDIPKGAYPDMGDGRHCSKLSYEEWLEYASHQRAHGNYVEGVATVITFIMIAGLSYPMFTALMALIYMAGRETYSWGYRKWGPSGRYYGLWFNLALLTIAITAIVSALKFTNWGQAHLE